MGGTHPILWHPMGHLSSEAGVQQRDRLGPVIVFCHSFETDSQPMANDLTNFGHQPLCFTLTPLRMRTKTDRCSIRHAYNASSLYLPFSIWVATRLGKGSNYGHTRCAYKKSAMQFLNWLHHIITSPPKWQVSMWCPQASMEPPF